MQTMDNLPALVVFLRILQLVATGVALGLSVAPDRAGYRSRPVFVFAVCTAVLAGLASLPAADLRAVLAGLLAASTGALLLLRDRPRTAWAVAVMTWVMLATQAVPGVWAGLTVLALTAAVAGTAATFASHRTRGGEVTAVAGLLIAAAATGTHAWLRGPSLSAGTVLSTWFGRVTLAVVVLAVTGAVIAALFRRGNLARRSVGALSVTALSLSAVAAQIGTPATPAEPGVPLLLDVAVADLRLPVLVTPNRPGANLVHIGADGASAGLNPDQLTPGTARPGTTGSWVPMLLPAGRSTLWIGMGPVRGSLRLDTGHGTPLPDPGPDGPECASAVLGGLLAGPAAPLAACPAETLGPSDAAALRAMVGFVAKRGVRAISVVTDGSPRGIRAASGVRAAAARNGLSVRDTGRHPLFVVSGWAAADPVLRQVASGERHAEGSYLAPWLLTGPLLAIPSAPLLALRFDPRRPEADRYLGELDRRFPGATPTGPGYERFSAGLSPSGLRLYAASQLFTPGQGGHQHGADAGWVPSGTVVAVTGELT